MSARTTGSWAALALIGLIGSGCGADAPSETAGTSSAATVTAKALTAQDKAVKFSQCLRGNGVPDFPDPNTKGDYEYGVSVTPEVFRKAIAACKALQPPGSLSSKRTPKQQTGALAFAKCIRSKGVKDFPDPVNGEPAIDTTKIPSTDRPGGMDLLNAAIAKCRPVSGLASGGQGG